MRRIRTAVVDIAGDLPDVDLDEADEWRVLVTHDGVPLEHVVLASPGAGAGRATLDLALRRIGEQVLCEEAVRARFRARLDAPARPRRPARISVVVPTHRRPALVADLLESIAALDPAPDEVIVVDNDPGQEDCRQAALRAGARYVREERRGLNVARATGLRAATGDVVVFTDDDCIVTPRWLCALRDLFSDPTVGLVTGPGFAFELETGAQLRREEEAAFDKGMRRQWFDRRTTAPAHSGVVGSGNSMALRRDVALTLGLFPPDLDAGTPAPAAGDLYAIYRVLCAGYQAVYEPRMVFFHRHPRSGLRKLIRNYGLGVGAYYTKLLVEARELVALRLWYWFPRVWVEAVVDSLTNAVPDRGRIRVRWEYLTASLRGPLAWREAVRALDDAGRVDLEAARSVHETIAALAAAKDELQPALAREAIAIDLRADAAIPRSARAVTLSAGAHVLGQIEVPDGRVDDRLLETLRTQLGAREWRALVHSLCDAAQPVSAASPPAAANERAEPLVLRPQSSDSTAFWRAVVEEIRGSDADLVAIVLPGTEVGSGWLSELTPGLEGARVAALVGAGLAAHDPPAALELMARPRLRSRYPLTFSPPQYIVVRRDVYDRLGGFDLGAAPLGIQAPVVDYLERALDAELTVAHLDTQHVAPIGTRRPARTRNEWQRARARAALLTRDAQARGLLGGLGLLFWSGVVPLLRFRRPTTVPRPGVRHSAGSLAAFALGVATALRRRG